jgi:hypothetical protein
MSTEMIVVPASHADVGDIVSLVNSAYRGESAGWTNEVGLLAGPRTDPATLAEVACGRKGHHAVDARRPVFRGAGKSPVDGDDGTDRRGFGRKSLQIE